MSILKNKLIIALPLIVIAIISVFSLAAVPSINPVPHNLPTAIVNEDQGLTSSQVNMGSTIVANIQSASTADPDEDPAIKWIEVDSEEEVKAGLNNQEYYAALVIPQDFSEKQASLMKSDPAAPSMRIYINQGMSASASNMAGQMLTQAVDGMSTKMRTELLAVFDQQGGTVTTKQAIVFANIKMSHLEAV